MVFFVLFCFSLIFFIQVQLMYNIILVSGIQHSDLVFLQIILHYRLLQDNAYNSLCCTVYPCCISILYIGAVFLISASCDSHSGGLRTTF